ncbi:Arm DNA-binding domain-containing protein [Methylomonas sp. LL1]|uniref:Arm DNA-binding domain-containing protein n=1 Tax=Methylomonas sp. LL1 TaxID=2785785 RepID=UPI001E3BC4C2|nr:Arm DNA-binding domain-containing protein [Methylomonas sp. LL1]
MAFDDYPGLHLSAMAKVRTWFYRYRSSFDGRLRQVSIGHWPPMSFSAAIVAWEALKNQRDSGNDSVLEVKQVKLETKAFLISKLL